MKIPETLRQLSLLLKDTEIQKRDVIINRFTILILVIILTTSGAVVYAQVTGGDRIYGRVTNTDGDPVPNATVTLKEITMPERTVITHTTTTNSTGYYEFNNKGAMEFRIFATKGNLSSEPEHHHLYFSSQEKMINIVIE